MNAPVDPRPDTFPKQHLELSDAEQRSGTLSPEHRRLAALVLSTRGYVIFKNALPQDYIARIGREVTEIYDDCRQTHGAIPTGTTADALHHVARGTKKNAAFWYREGRWRIFPWLVAPMSDPELLANAFTTPVLEDLLGDDFYCKYVSSDTCLNGSMLQSPHSDIDGEQVMVNDVWRPRGYIVNIPTMECGLHNGPIEVWPGGSHMWTSALMKKYGLSPDIQDGRNPPVEVLAEYLPSAKLSISPGEVMIRDLAMWHRGTPNPTEGPRTMLTIGYFRKSYPYGYGDPAYNLDKAAYQRLSPRVRQLFDNHFSLRSELKRGRKKLKSAVGRAGRALLKKALLLLLPSLPTLIDALGSDLMEFASGL